MKLIEHIKLVAKDDVRTFFAPFVGVWRVMRKELKRPPVRSPRD